MSEHRELTLRTPREKIVQITILSGIAILSCLILAIGSAIPFWNIPVRHFIFTSGMAMVCCYIYFLYTKLEVRISNSEIEYKSLHNPFQLKVSDIVQIRWVKNTGYKSFGGIIFESLDNEDTLPFSGLKSSDVVELIDFVKQNFSTIPQSDWELIESMYFSLKKAEPIRSRSAVDQQ